MTKKKVLFLIPFLLVTWLLLYCWTTVLIGDITATWRHYIGLFLFISIVFYIFKDFSKAVIGLGVYLLLATINLLAISPAVRTSWIRVGSFETPPVQLLSLGLFILYFILNLNTLIDIELDYKEARQQRNNN